MTTKTKNQTVQDTSCGDAWGGSLVAESSLERFSFGLKAGKEKAPEPNPLPRTAQGLNEIRQEADPNRFA